MDCSSSSQKKNTSIELDGKGCRMLVREVKGGFVWLLFSAVIQAPSQFPVYPLGRKDTVCYNLAIQSEALPVVE
jgi:hypothetical protein